MIAAGRLNRSVTLQERRLAEQPGGRDVTSYRDVWTVDAEIKQSASDETPVNGGTESRVTYAVTIRYYAGLDQTWRLRTDGGRTLAISSIVERGNYQTPDEQVITAHEVT